MSATTTMGAGNVTIYAHWSQNSYSYTVQHLSSNGTVLGTGSVTHEYGSTYTISPNSYSGYTSPAAQTVTWDSTQKTIVFYYTPVETSATTKTGSLESYLTYSATVEHRNRTANSIQIRVVWTTTIKKGYFIVYGERFTALSGGVSTGTVVVLNAGTWKNSASSARTATGTSDWITVPVSGTDITQINLAIYFWQVNYNDTNMTKNYGEARADATWSIAIPNY